VTAGFENSFSREEATDAVEATVALVSREIIAVLLAAEIMTGGGGFNGVWGGSASPNIHPLNRSYSLTSEAPRISSIAFFLPRVARSIVINLQIKESSTYRR
jgi:hypothetical protein